MRRKTYHIGQYDAPSLQALRTEWVPVQSQNQDHKISQELAVKEGLLTEIKNDDSDYLMDHYCECRTLIFHQSLKGGRI